MDRMSSYHLPPPSGTAITALFEILQRGVQLRPFPLCRVIRASLATRSSPAIFAFWLLHWPTSIPVPPWPLSREAAAAFLFRRRVARIHHSRTRAPSFVFMSPFVRRRVCCRPNFFSRLLPWLLFASPRPAPLPVRAGARTRLFRISPPHSSAGGIPGSGFRYFLPYSRFIREHGFSADSHLWWCAQ